MAASKVTTLVSTKGQVILPKAIREKRHWPAGTRLEVQETADGVLLKAAEPIFPPTRWEDVYGCLKYSGPPKSLKEMDDAITAEVKQRHSRGRY